MLPGEFKFNGVSSTKYGVLVSERPTRITSIRSYLTGNASNRSGTIIRDGQVYSNSELTLSCWFKATDAVTLDDVAQWLDPTGYVNLELWYDAKYQYKVVTESSLSVTTIGLDHDYYVFDVKFTVYPFKYEIASLTSVNVPVTIDNSASNIPSAPLITVKATAANIVVKVSNDSYSLKGCTVGTTYTIDSEIPRCSDPSKMVGLNFPHISNSKVSISVTGGTATIIPRLVRRVV